MVSWPSFSSSVMDARRPIMDTGSPGRALLFVSPVDSAARVEIARTGRVAVAQSPAITMERRVIMIFNLPTDALNLA
jgi:hypothetical protein